MTSDMRYVNIPQELRDRTQWVCYRIEERDGNKTKIPYRADKVGRRRAKTNDSRTWHTYEEVIEAASKQENRFDGIGFVLCEGDPFVFIDLDHVVEDGVVEDWAQEIIDKVGSFTELSQSGTGTHVIARATKPGPRCRTHTHPKFEIYDHVRLVVFTGKLLPGAASQIVDAQDAIDDIYVSVFGDHVGLSPARETVRNLQPVGMSDPLLIERACSATNGEKFSRLWSGNTGDYDNDHSAADLALCFSLAFWTRKEPARSDRLFRQSGLMRPKWDEKRGSRTYGQMTIEKAIEQTMEVYTCPASRRKTPDVTEEQKTEARKRIADAKVAATAAAVFEVTDALALLNAGEYADAVKELKDGSPQLDLRELKGAVSRSRKMMWAGESGAYPELVVTNRQLRDMGDEAIRLLERANVPPTLFVRSGALCHVVEDERGCPMIRSITDEIIQARLAKTCDLVAETEDGMKNVVPPQEHCVIYLVRRKLAVSHPGNDHAVSDRQAGRKYLSDSRIRPGNTSVLPSDI